MYVNMVALCVTEKDHYILRRFFPNTLSPLSLTDFLETSPHDVRSSAIEEVPFTFS